MEVHTDLHFENPVKIILERNIMTEVTSGIERDGTIIVVWDCVL